MDIRRRSGMTAKQKVLELLESSRDRYLSGEEIASGIGLTRNSVWKAVQVLRKEGYAIEASTNRGYRIREDSDIFSAEGLEPFLMKGVPRENLHVYSSLRSTNRTAKEMAVSGAPDGSVILADSQTEGRARREGGFFSPSGGIYISFILRPPAFPFTADRTLTAYGGVCAAEAVASAAGICPVIRGVNDLEVNGKKICGIMTETLREAESGKTEWIVTGIGLNFRVMDEEIPEELRKRVSSLYPDGHPRILRNRLAAELINMILIRGRLMTEEEVMSLFSKYRQASGCAAPERTRG